MGRKPIAVVLTDTHLKESNRRSVYQVFELACKIAKEFKIPVLSGGDNFDSRKSQPLENLVSFKEILELFNENQVEFYSIIGNHDKVDQSKSESYLSPYKYFPNIHIIDEYEFIEIGGRELILLSYFTEIEYYSLLEEIVKLNVSDSLLLTHIDIQGFTMNGNNISEHGFNKSIFSSFRKVLVGHYHDYSCKDNIEYIGSSLQHNYGESYEKGIRILYDDFSTEIYQDTSSIQSFSTFRVGSLVEFENLKIDDVPGNKRIVFTGSKEDLISISKGESKRIKDLLENSKLEFREKETTEKGIESNPIIETQLDKESIKNYFRDWCNQEKIEDIDYGLKLLDSI